MKLQLGPKRSDILSKISKLMQLISWFGDVTLCPNAFSIRKSTNLQNSRLHSQWVIFYAFFMFLRDFVFDIACPEGVRDIEDEISQNPSTYFSPILKLLAVQCKSVSLRRHTPRGCNLVIPVSESFPFFFVDSTVQKPNYPPIEVLYHTDTNHQKPTKRNHNECHLLTRSTM